MSNERTALYEGMFLFPQSATANLQEAVDHLKELLDKSGVSVINFRKWDDRRLAYEIDGNKRGVYFLVYFNSPTAAISDLERRCNQSEQLLRMMVTRAEHLPTEIIEANEGAQDLADEIKLRGEKTSEKGTSAGSTVTRKEDQVAKEPTPEPEIPEEVANEVAEEVAQVATEEPSET
ncbi:MAG: 30S ribosomal protein S6 [Phycisphaerales bacterium]|nr:30S ribosomal protein S6 [Planctomycetota bacterium]MBL6997653.1 30S ribosomal protein S6 [Phycisphaerales bacterium]